MAVGQLFFSADQMVIMPILQGMFPSLLDNVSVMKLVLEGIWLQV